VINIYDENTIKEFGKRLRSLRKEKGYTQIQLAERAGITFSQIGRIERGLQNTTLSTIGTLAKALEISPKTLLDFPFEGKK
jgi:transcriptional regulator with XRE-family HTH domain